MGSKDEFSPTESAEDTGGEKFLNRGTADIVPKAVIKTLLLVGIVLGFGIGYIVSSLLLAGVSCGSNQLSQMTSSPSALEGSDDIVENLKSNFINCTKTSMTTPASIVAGIIGGSVLAYPFYLLTKAIAGNNYIKSII